MTITSAQMELRQRREATIREHIDAENHHHPNRAVATFSSYRASYDIPAMEEAGQLADANAVRAMWVGIIAAFPDIHFEPGNLATDGGSPELLMIRGCVCLRSWC